MTQKRTCLILILIGIIYFSLFVFPNNTGAQDRSMISIFSQDEYAQYSYLLRMYETKDTLTHTIYNFIAYQHYYYGFPFYLTSVLVTLPVQWAQGLQSRGVQDGMLALRQFVNVLPMILAILIMVFTQTKFRSFWTSVASFVFLLAIPAVVANNMWWHPDSLATLFVVLTIYFLDRDQLKFGRNFLLAAVACGLATGTKVIGLFFFLTIPLYIFIGLYQHLINWKKAIGLGIGFVAIMIVSIIASNPFLLLRGEFMEMLRIQSNQSQAMSVGWTLYYAKGVAPWIPVIREYYAFPLFIFIVLALYFWAIYKNHNRILNLTILSWVLPYSIYVLFHIVIRPHHFFLPVIIPLLSVVSIVFESLETQFKSWKLDLGFFRPLNLFYLIMFGAIVYQAFIYVQTDVSLYTQTLMREQQSLELRFYSTLQDRYLNLLPADEEFVIYRDVRVYFPQSGNRKVLSFFNTISYAEIQKRNPDIIILWSQRVEDYTNQGVEQAAIDKEKFKEIQRFFLDAKNNTIDNYRLIYKDGIGLAFARNDVYEKYFITK